MPTVWFQISQLLKKLADHDLHCASCNLSCNELNWENSEVNRHMHEHDPKIKDKTLA